MPGPFSPQLADYDGDGLVDLISGSSCCQGACIYVFRRLKDGGFAERRRIDLHFRGMSVEDTPIAFGLKGLASKPAVADWNGDGALDLVIGGWSDSGRFAVAYGPLAGQDELTIEPLWPEDETPNSAIGKFFPAADGAAPLHHVLTNPAVADWDGDGRPDLILGGYRDFSKEQGRNTELGVYWMRNIGPTHAPKLGEPQRLLAVEENRLHVLRGLAATDWNGDGRTDLLVSRFDYRRVGTGNDRTLEQNKVWVYLRRAP